MKRVITYGTFDLLHYGHINLLRRAKQQGDYLIVALSTDEFPVCQHRPEPLDFEITYKSGQSGAHYRCLSSKLSDFLCS
ncbi:MAG: adenylyltransferase/cytidyltransferase family protein [Erysipelotrichia bacterium]|nr:adenylyltransferase/cytidyltransferase family protein [Erysipelotrichia bacterium]